MPDGGRHDLVLGANRLIVDIVQSMLGEAGDHPPVAVLVDPDQDQWRQVAEFTGGVVLVTSDLEDEAVSGAVQRGVHAVLGVAGVVDELEGTVEAVRRGEAVLTPTQARIVVDALRREKIGARKLTLSRREGEILQCIVRGRSVKQTANELGVTPKTVENLQSRLFRKLEVRNRAQAVARAHELGLLGGAKARSPDPSVGVSPPSR